MSVVLYIFKSLDVSTNTKMLILPKLYIMILYRTILYWHCPNYVNKQKKYSQQNNEYSFFLILDTLHTLTKICLIKRHRVAKWLLISRDIFSKVHSGQRIKHNIIQTVAL